MLARRTNVFKYTVLKLHVFLFSNDAEVPVKLMVIDKEIEKIGFFDLQNSRWLNSLNVHQAGFLRIKAAQIGYPVTLSDKLQVVLHTLLIHVVHLKAARHNKSVVLAHIALL